MSTAFMPTYARPCVSFTFHSVWHMTTTVSLSLDDLGLLRLVGKGAGLTVVTDPPPGSSLELMQSAGLISPITDRFALGKGTYQLTARGKIALGPSGDPDDIRNIPAMDNLVAELCMAAAAVSPGLMSAADFEAPVRAILARIDDMIDGNLITCDGYCRSDF